MSLSAEDVVEPFDLALPEYYRPRPRYANYKRLIEAGCAAGDPLALYAMATWHLNGQRALGGGRSFAKAVPLLRKAAVTLNRASYDLAVCYARGAGVPKNLRKAYQLFDQAAKQGSLQARFVQADWLMTGTGVRKNVARGTKLRARAEKVLQRYADLVASTSASRQRR